MNVLNFSLCCSFLGSDHLRDVFGHMGLSDKDIVVLSGAHTLVSSCKTIKTPLFVSFTGRV